MKTLLSISLIFCWSIGFAQSENPVKYVKDGDRVAVTHYYDNGSVKETGYFKDGVPDGKWETFSVDGEKTAEINYKDGIRHGEFRIWDQFSNAYVEMKYAKGNVISAHKYLKSESFASSTK